MPERRKQDKDEKTYFCIALLSREIYLFLILFTTLLRRVLKMNFVVTQFPTQALKLSD